ncbi:response regulator transcription factor [Altererythrobacter arenosus]|uniref:Response regulator transcription factor n=1 Tax=Altererythrobacter arenosus TaxID=3032592 RepID=A0ABY8FVV9_9SPHN|nr:response regulator transcription factor [Altererythrobacter sp. CAU 1644]WFL76159.1 response regulator transcription factor [Altererythrobacter sp. CAU 1644]
MAAKNRILIVDDHPICIDALEIAAHQAARDLVADHAATKAQMVARLRTVTYDAVFLDLALPDATGIAALQAARQTQPDTSIAIVSSSLDAPLVRDAMAAGAKAYLPKSLSLKELASAIAVVLHGGIYFPDHVLASLAPAVRNGTEASAKLSRMQLRVLEAAASGNSNKGISDELGIAVPTVKSHLSEIFRILEVSNRNEAILAFQRLQ